MLENTPILPTDKDFNWLQKSCMRLAELPPVEPHTNWISVKDALPDNIDDVLVTTDYDNVSVGYYRYCRDGSSNKEWYIYNKEYSNDVSAWMPLPTPYVETKEVTQ